LPHEPGPQPHSSTKPRAAGRGWLTFAALMVSLAGIFNLIDGFVALSNARFYVVGSVYAWTDLRIWGGIALALGLVELVAGVAIMRGQPWARWFGIIAAGLNAIAQMAYIPAYPWWTLLIIALDLIVIYGLAAYGGRDASPA
jgi:hypothetical protein